MMFIDGNWLYKSRSALFEKLNEPNGFEIDYKKIPSVICEDVANYLDQDVDTVRVAYFGTIPSRRSGFNTSKQDAFYDFLETSCGYDTTIHEIDVNGSEPRNDENWVVAALSSALLYYAAMDAFDIAVILGDDENYEPCFRFARQLGKRIQVVGTRVPAEGRRTLQLNASYRRPKVSDFPPIFIEDHAEEMRLVRATRKRMCRECGEEEETTWAGPDFFCSRCRNRHRSPDQGE